MKHKKIILFPFLIGRIRTEMELYIEPLVSMFPFLIGRIRTELGADEYASKYMFPFLIGRIRTMFPIVSASRAALCFHPL